MYIKYIFFLFIVFVVILVPFIFGCFLSVLAMVSAAFLVVNPVGYKAYFFPLNVFILFIAIFFTLLHAQAPDTAWTKAYYRGTDMGKWIEETVDGGFIMVGKSQILPD